MYDASWLCYDLAQTHEDGLSAYIHSTADAVAEARDAMVKASDFSFWGRVGKRLS